MRVRTDLVLAAAGLALACQTDDARPGGATPSPVVAEVAGESITESELDEWIRERLFERETRGGSPARLYELRKQYLDRMIDERLIEAESERREISVQELFEQEIDARGGVSDQEVAAFYEQNHARLGDATLESLAPRIRAHLESRRADDVLATLRERSDVSVLLEPARLQVAAQGPSRGPSDARVTIIEFSDFQCPFCQRAAPVIEELLAKYPQDVRVFYRHLPLANHSRARPAAEAAACADDQGRFWPYHDLLFANARALGDGDLVRYAGEVGLDVARFQQCFAERRFQDLVEADAEAARAAGITGTPAFVVNGVLLSGARPASEFIELIEAELAPGSGG